MWCCILLSAGTLISERKVSMSIYLPKQIVQLNPTFDSPLFFLAGPVRGGGDWQADMSESIFDQEPSALIVCPTRWSEKHRLSHYFHQPFSDAENRQLVYERHYIKQAGLEKNVNGCVILWFGLESEEHPHDGPEPYAMDTRRETGKLTAFAEVLLWFPELREKMDVRLVVGGDPNFHGLEVILFELSEAFGQSFPFYETMEDVVTNALRIARQ